MKLKRLSRGQRQNVLIALLMLPVFAAIHLAAYWLRFDGEIRSTFLGLAVRSLLWTLAIKSTVFAAFRVYHGWRRFVTFQDLITIIKATSAASVVWALIDYLVIADLTVPRSVFLADWGLTIVAVGGLRSIGRLIQERHGADWILHRRTSVFIVGANDSGEALLRSIRRSPQVPYRVVGFIAEDGQSLGTTIGGVPVIGSLPQTCELAKRYGVSEVLIAAGELSGKQVRTLVDDGRQANVSVKVLPSYEQLLRGTMDLKPRTVSIEDLLRRDPVQLNLRELHHWLDDRVLLITGSAGSIGSEICRQLLQFSPRKLVLVDQSETGQFFLEHELQRIRGNTELVVCLADVCDKRRMRSLFESHRPDIVFHAAAYKHVPLMERNPSEAVKNIVTATRVVADLANNCEVGSFVMISTDKAVNPTSVMGACKRVAELYVQSMSLRSSCHYVTVRFGNVLDSAGSVVPIFRDQIARGGPITVTHPDMTRFFMTIPEASQLVLQAGAMGHGGEIFVLDMGDPVRIVDLAHDMIRLSGLKVNEDIEIEFTGMRPGEKLYEELHDDGEQHLPTSHPKIMVTSCDRRLIDQITVSVDRLAAVANEAEDTISDELERILPQFQGTHLRIFNPEVRRRMAA